MSGKEFKKKFGKRVRFFREQAKTDKKSKLSQAEVGNAVGRSGETISKIERGITFPKPKVFEPLAKKLNVSVADFFDFPIIKNDRKNSRKKTTLIKEVIKTIYKLDEEKIKFVLKQIEELDRLKK